MSARRLRIDYLTDDELAAIEETAYRLLDEVGISLQHAQAVERLAGLGCKVRGERVFIPPEVARRGLTNVTSQRAMHSRDGTYSIPFGDGQLRFHNGGGPPFILDGATGGRRPATSDDLARMTRLLDALPNVDEITPLFSPQEVPPALMNVISTSVMLRNTRKPVSGAAAESPDDARTIIEMAAACAGGLAALRERPFLTLSVSPVSPLIFTEKVTEAIMVIAEAGIPFHALPAPSLGATGPITLAGCLAQQHAEVLASFLIVAATRPGSPVSYCSRINPLDLRRAVSRWGGPEVGIASAAATQLSHRIGFPCDGYGLATHASVLDASYAYQKFANAVVPALAGTDIMSGVGTLDSGLAGSLEAAVIDDEVIGVLKRIVAGYEVTPETLAFDVMAEVIPAGGMFLAEMHTVRHMRAGATWASSLGDAAAAQAEPNVAARAAARVDEILSKRDAPALPEHVAQELDEIVARVSRDAKPA
ncbi:MAG: trimethylamine methyltransferase family protein [Anaerolineae bacterium]|jgi:trimethylamine--corrinoid protein Co-methyltransferase|nr:trimethylamine methyltransferase family protein [Anaerolineae bacterium]